MVFPVKYSTYLLIFFHHKVLVLSLLFAVTLKEIRDRVAIIVASMGILSIGNMTDYQVLYSANS